MSEQAKTLVPKLRFPEFLNEEGWEQKKLKDLFEIGSGKDYKHLSTGDIPVYGSGGYMLSVDDFLYDGESVCIGRKGTIDKPMLLNGQFWTVDTLFYTHSFKDCSPRFVFSIFQNIDWLKHNEAGGVPSLSKTTINEIPTFIPRPKEQQKIADCLSSLDDLITAQNQKVEALKQHKKGLMQQLFPAEGETVPKLRFPEFESDGEWVSEKLENLIDTVSPPQKLKTSQYQITGEYPIFDQSQSYICGWTDNKDALVKDNLPLIIFGDHTCALKIANKPFAQGADGIKILQIKNKVETQFLYQSLQNKPLVMEEYKRHFSIFKERIVFYPNIDTGEQQKIANFLTSLDDLITTQTQQLEAYKAHKKGLMQQLFPALHDYIT